MDQAAEPLTHLDAPVDLTKLERIEGELRAVERALEQIDQGVYEGFEGLDLLAGQDAEPHALESEDGVPEP